MQWLRDAHAMEEQAEQMLSSTASRIENYPEVKRAMDEHLAETRSQAERVRSCIARRGGDTSSLKDLAAKLVAFGQGMSGMFVSDEIVKGAMASYTFEHMEIASYRVLITAAEAVDDEETARVCAEILDEEKAAAERLLDLLPAITARYLQRDEDSEATAKH